MIEIKSLIAGSILGATFALMNLPIPAPPVFAGVLGVIGVWIGYQLAGG